MLSRKQIKEASTQEVENEYQRARDQNFDLHRSRSWFDYTKALRKELAKRKGNKDGF